MSRSIPISPKHGVNPSLLTCFWCQKNSTGIALLGRLKDDREAPEKILDMSYKPCEDCKKTFEQGYTLFEVVNAPLFDGHVPVQTNENGELYPTSNFVTIKNPDVIRGMFTPQDIVDSILEKRKAYIEQKSFKMLTHAIESARKETEN